MPNDTVSTRARLSWKHIGFALLALAGLVMALLLCGIVLLGGAWDSATTPVEDVASYDQIRADLSGSGLVDHFPIELPAYASDVDFYYLPKFLQGGMHFQLRVTLPEDEVAVILAKCREEALGTHDPDADRVTLSNDPRTPSYLVGTSEDSSAWPDTFEVYVLHAHPAGSPEFEWNHGDTYGIAVDEAHSVVVYWAKYW